jgi:conjugal transfer ATP-binding protein TraC
MLDQTLAHRLELWGFEDGVMVFRDFSLGAALRIQALDVSCLSDDAINELKTQIRRFLNGLPPGASIQIVQEVVPGNSETITGHLNRVAQDAMAPSPLIAEITSMRVEKFLKMDAAGQIPKQNLYLVLRKPFERAHKKSWMSFLRKKSAVLKEEVLKSEIEFFKRTVENLETSLTSVGIAGTKLGDQEVFSLLYRQWNPDRPIAPKEMSNSDVRDQVCLTDAVIGQDHFVLGNVFHKVISLKNLPEEQTYSAMVEALKNLPFESRLYFTIDVLDQNKEISSLQLQRRMAYASVVGKRGVADLDSQAKLQDIEAILEEMIQGNEKVFKVSMNIVVRAKDEYALDSQVSETLQTLRSMNGTEGMLETIAAFDVFSEFALPNARAPERAIKVNTSVVADLLPLYGNWRGFENPSVLLRTREGSLISFDPFSREFTNSNMIVSGGSGAGKSYFANSLISQMLKENPKVFILDIGASYRRTCENLGGQYIELGIKSNLSINPFSMDGIDREDTENLDRKIKFLVALVELMTKEDGRPGLGRLERSEVERLVKEVLNEESEPQLRHLMARLLNSPEMDLKRLGKILGLWCGDAPFGKFVDRPTTVKLDRDIVCFDLKGLDAHPELQSVCLFIITDLIWREVQKDRTRLKFTIFDECWKILQDDAAAQFIGEVFRTYRKYRASAIAISQTMDDFVKSKVAAAILPNSSIKWILKQKGADQASLKNALQLNDREMQLISSLESQKGHFSEAFLMAEDKRQVIRIESTPLEYWLFTTDPTDLAMIGKLKAETKPEANDLDILRTCALRYPQGASGQTGGTA